MRHERMKAPLVRLPAKTNLQTIAGFAAQTAVILVGAVTLIAALYLGRVILIPAALAFVIGLMFGPYADFIERRGVGPAISAAVVVVTFLLVLSSAVTAFAMPLSEWMERLPVIWLNLKAIIADWKGVLAGVGEFQEQLRVLMGGDKDAAVAVSEPGAAAQLAFLAPAFVGQIAIFLGALYFFLATRFQIKDSVLRLCINRRLRWRVAHIFRDAEVMVSKYLVSITAINAGLGVAVAIAMEAIGVPSPLLWGLLAALLNYIGYVGPALMAVVLFGVGLASFSQGWTTLLPAAVYLCLNFAEAQFVTPQVLGRQLTLNPLVIFLAIVFWLWIWGPAGGFIAVPALLVVSVILNHTVPLAAKSASSVP